MLQWLLIPSYMYTCTCHNLSQAPYIGNKITITAIFCLQHFIYHIFTFITDHQDVLDIQYQIAYILIFAIKRFKNGGGVNNQTLPCISIHANWMSHVNCGSHTLLGPVWTKLGNSVHRVHKLSAVCTPLYTVQYLASVEVFLTIKVIYYKSQFNRSVCQPAGLTLL